MLSIGEFSKVSCVTPKTLRYYDEINLLKPKLIGNNNYRYYEVSQLKTMLFINRLKSYKFSLEEITHILKDENNHYLKKHMLSKMEEIQQEIDLNTHILKNIKLDLENLERGIDIMSYLDHLEVKILERPSVNILASKQIMSVDDFGKYFGRLYEKAAKEKLTITGNIISIYHDQEFDHMKSEIEVGLPVKEVVTGTRELEGGLCATITHKGVFSELSSSYAKLVEWIEKEGYQSNNPPYEIYNFDRNTTPPEDYITEIYFPIKKK